jgi:hypothetical protein
VLISSSNALPNVIGRLLHLWRSRERGLGKLVT